MTIVFIRHTNKYYRPNDNPLIVHVSGIEMLKTIALWGPREISIYGDMIDRYASFSIGPCKHIDD